jgi:hypothetical protein
MSVVHLRFDEPQTSFVCTCCGKFPVVDAAIAQDAVDHHLSLYCEDCAENIGPREVAGARTATNTASLKLPEFDEIWKMVSKHLLEKYGVPWRERASAFESAQIFHEFIVRQLQA